MITPTDGKRWVVEELYWDRWVSLEHFHYKKEALDRLREVEYEVMSGISIGPPVRVRDKTTGGIISRNLDYGESDE